MFSYIECTFTCNKGIYDEHELTSAWSHRKNTLFTWREVCLYGMAQKYKCNIF